MKNKLVALTLSVLLLAGTFIIETSAFSNSRPSVTASEYVNQPRKKRRAVRRTRQKYVIHRKSGKVRRAVCRDGSITLSRNRRGTCSRHGGVRRWLR